MFAVLWNPSSIQILKPHMHIPNSMCNFYKVFFLKGLLATAF